MLFASTCKDLNYDEMIFFLQIIIQIRFVNKHLNILQIRVN